MIKCELTDSLCDIGPKAFFNTGAQKIAICSPPHPRRRKSVPAQAKMVEPREPERSVLKYVSTGSAEDLR